MKGHLKAGIDSVRNAKLRSFWTMMGVIIGVTSVITVVGIGQGIKEQIGGQIHKAGKNLVTIRPAQLEPNQDPDNLKSITGLTISQPLTADDVATIQRVKNVRSSAPLTIAPGTVKGPTGAYNKGFVIGTTADLPPLLNQSLAYGVFLSKADLGTNVAVLGQTAVDEMFDEDVPLGRSFTFRGQDFIVGGIFNQFSVSPLNQQADFNKAIFIQQDVAQDLTNDTAPTYAMLVRPAKANQTEQVAKDIRKALDRTHGGQSNFDIQTGNQNLASNESVLDLLTRLIAGIAAISLLVGGIGIMNVMLVSVAERTHEIGIRKAVGATNRQILNQFLIEATVLTFSGGIIGIILAGLINLGLRATTNLQPVMNWQIVVIATGVSLAIGIIFGTVPAAKAARKDPIEALRSD